MHPTLFPPGVPVVKRSLDLLLTIVGIVLLSPVLAVVCLILLYTEGRPIFFRQPRAGLHGCVFHIYKFRTMRNVYDEQGRLLPDDQRISRLGKFLRATSLDELPEMINVLRGEMSWVGPRPLLARYLERYNAGQMRRHE